MEKRYISKSAAQTENIAEKLAKEIVPGDFVALFGDLGAGKTAFCRGFARGLGYSGSVTSPTFAVIHEYSGGRLTIYHFDMYRIETFDDLYSTGYFEYLQAGGVIITEWSENIENVLPESRYDVFINSISDSTREITIKRILNES